MAEATFNPNGYNRTEIAKALENGLKVPEGIEGVPERLTTVEEVVAGLPDGIAQLQNAVGTLNTTVAEHDTEINTAESNIQKIFDLFDQVIYRGSDNKLQLDESNMTIEGTGLTATFSNGVLTITKSTTIVGDDPYISFTGVTIPAGTWYLGVPKDGGLIISWYAELKDSYGYTIAYTGNDGHSEEFTIAQDYTDCTLNISVYKVAAFSEKKLVPYLSSVILNKDTSMPYFKSLIEVSSNE